MPGVGKPMEKREGAITTRFYILHNGNILQRIELNPSAELSSSQDMHKSQPLDSPRKSFRISHPVRHLNSEFHIHVRYRRIQNEFRYTRAR